MPTTKFVSHAPATNQKIASRTPTLANFCLLRIEVHFDGLYGFVRRRFPFPLADRILGGLCQHRMPAFTASTLIFPLGSTSASSLTVPFKFRARARAG